MSGISHEDYLNQLFKQKAEQKRRDAALPPEKKLEIWLRLREMVHYIQSGLGKEAKDR